MRKLIHNHMKLAGVLVLVCSLAGFVSWQLSSRIRGQIVARFDLARGHYEVLVLGLAPRWRPEYARLLRERYRIESRVVAGCVVSEWLLAYVEGYNEVSVNAANRRFGRDVFRESIVEASRNWRLRQPATRDVSPRSRGHSVKWPGRARRRCPSTDEIPLKSSMLDRRKVQDAIDAGQGILRLEPCWVPRSFMIPGRRLKLHPDDLYAFGGHRGGINERWFSSTTKASNGPATLEDEGLSYVRPAGADRFLLKAAIETAGDLLLGSGVVSREGGWNLLCKFFDNMGPIPHHLHQSDALANLVGQRGKPEAYYFPPQYNLTENNFPYTFMGLEPGTTKDDIHRCLENWNKGDNGILFHSRAYRLQPGTGWQINPGILHAPGSLVTYEPQVNSDVFAMFQSVVEGRIIDWSLLTKDVRPEYHDDLDYLVEMLDWNANVNPEFGKTNRVFPKPVRPPEAAVDDGYRENWVSYGTPYYSAKELTVLPNRSAVIADSAAYGLILTQGHGLFGRHEVAAPAMIRFGEMTQDELFVAADAAKAGVRVQNTSATDPLVILKHFGPGNPDAA